MADPFQNVSAAGAEFIATIAEGLEARAADPSMLPIIEAYLDAIDWGGVRRAVEIGSGTGPIARMIADRAPWAQVTGVEPSAELVAHAERLRGDRPNLRFETGDGAVLRHADGSFDLAVQHTVLSHVPEPAALVAEAFRVLRPGGTLVVCDGDFSKASLALASGDPLHAVAQHFVENFVTDRFLAGKLRAMSQAAGFVTRDSRVASRLLTDSPQMGIWVRLSGDRMVEDGTIGRPLADALLAEYQRRLEGGTLYGYQVFATLIATKP
jgi:SAM-dependent methyltransferase